MKSIIRSLIAAIALSVMGASAAVLPRVSTTDTIPNQWTSNISGVLQAAKTTNLPILLVMINDSSTGQGCAHCMQFITYSLNTQRFADIVNKYQFYMVLLNYWSSPREPNYGGVSESVFNSYFHHYQAGDNGYPQVVVIRPDGTRYKVWSYETRPVTTSGAYVNQYIEEAIADLSPKDTVFSLSAQSGNAVTVQGTTPGVWTGVVTRSGKSARTGSVAITLEGDNAALYKLSTSALAWDSSDGSKTFTVTGPNTFSGDVVSDNLTVKITASGFSGSEISYESSSQAVVFKDSRAKQTLQEFAAAHTGLDKLSASGRTWYVPSQNDGNALETMAAPDSTLEFTASVGGILKATVGTTRGSVSCTPSKGDKVDLSADQSVQFGVAAGDKITFKASASKGSSDPMVVGFKEFSFTPLTVVLSKPASNAQIPYGALLKDKTLVDLAWRASLGNCTFSLTCGGVTKNMGTVTSGNALDLGLVEKSPDGKIYTWSVRASYTAAGLRGTAVGTASSKFTVGALPAYDSTPLTLSAYKSLESAIDMSIKASDLGDVTYSATGLPNGMAIDSKTGVITGTSKRIKDYTVTVTAQNDYGSTSRQFTLQVQKLPKTYTSSKYYLYYFNGKDEIVAAGLLKISSSGKWTASIVQGGRTTKQQGKVTSVGDGISVVGSSGLNVTFSAANKMWLGTASGYRVYGKAIDKAGTDWKGSWNFGMASSSNEKLGGWALAKVSSSGKVSLKGLISGATKISGGGFSAVFPEAFVSANLPRWAGHGDVRFVHASPRAGLNVGCALFADGGVGGHATSGSQVFDVVEGSSWVQSYFVGLNGKTLVSFGAGDIKIPVVLKGRKLTFGSNKYKATISGSTSSGRVKISYQIGDKTYKATGIIYGVGDQSKLLGGGTLGDEVFAVAIE